MSEGGGIVFWYNSSTEGLYSAVLPGEQGRCCQVIDVCFYHNYSPLIRDCIGTRYRVAMPSNAPSSPVRRAVLVGCCSQFLLFLMILSP